MEGLLNKKNEPVYSKILKRLVPKPWASLSVTLKKKPLVVSLDAKQLKDVEKAHKASWKKWFGDGVYSAHSSLAFCLSHWHCWSWKLGKNCYPKVGELGYELPPEALQLQVDCVGATFELDEDGDLECEEDLEGVEGAQLAPVDAVLVAAALDAVGQTADADALAALEAAASGDDAQTTSADADVDAGDAGTMDVDAPADADDEKHKSCFDLMRSGALAIKKTPPGERPCCNCWKVIHLPNRTKCGNCLIQDKTLVVGSRQSSRPRVQTGSTVEFETLAACNLVMDPVTGLRPDGQTCRVCWDACYKEDGYNPDHNGRGGRHAVIGPDEAPCPACRRMETGSPYSAAVAWAHRKLQYLENSRAVGNR